VPEKIKEWRARHLDAERTQSPAPVPQGHLACGRPANLSDGISMGGYGTWAWAAQDPQHFAAIAPIVFGIGREGPKSVTPEFDQWATNLARIPVYAFVGALDKTVPPERSERRIAAIQKAGGKDARLKIYPEEGHNAGRVVVADQDFYDWLFAQKRD